MRNLIIALLFIAACSEQVVEPKTETGTLVINVGNEELLTEGVTTGGNVDPVGTLASMNFKGSKIVAISPSDNNIEDIRINVFDGFSIELVPAVYEVTIHGEYVDGPYSCNKSFKKEFEIKPNQKEELFFDVAN